MITATQQRDWLDTLLEAADRPESLADMPLPERKQETWRYTSVEGLMTTPFAVPNAADRAVARAALADLPADQPWRLVLLNGRFSPADSNLVGLPPTLSVGGLGQALAADPELLARWFATAGRHAPQLFTALNAALATDGPFLQLAAGERLEQPVELIHLSGGERPIHVPSRGLVNLGAGAQATLVEWFLGAGEADYFHQPLTEIQLGAGATLTHYRIQAEAPHAHHLSQLFLDPGTGSRYRGVTLSLGGAWARTEIHGALLHEKAELELAGLYTLAKGQLNDLHLELHHQAPGCTSRAAFKGILQGAGRAVFDGRILVERGAQRTDAQLTNHNLLLCRDAEIDTKPQLEIYADDVRCGHGATVGQLDPERIFYLRSRGIGEAEARRMLSLGFAGEVIDGIDNEPLREAAYARLAALLAGES